MSHHSRCLWSFLPSMARCQQNMRLSGFRKKRQERWQLRIVVWQFHCPTRSNDLLRYLGWREVETSWKLFVKLHPQIMVTNSQSLKIQITNPLKKSSISTMDAGFHWNVKGATFSCIWIFCSLRFPPSEDSLLHLEHAEKAFRIDRFPWFEGAAPFSTRVALGWLLIKNGKITSLGTSLHDLPEDSDQPPW